MVHAADRRHVPPFSQAIVPARVGSPLAQHRHAVPHSRSVLSWLPAGKSAAVCFSVDDVHPGRSTDAFEAGGDLQHGALGHLEWLLERNPHLHCTLFVTPDWRQIRPHADRSLLACIPGLRHIVFHTRPLPRGTMRLDRHPGFVHYLKSLPRTDVALHGLHHLRRGPQPLVEFAHCSHRQCERILEQSMRIFNGADLPFSPGLCPPIWHFSRPLGTAMAAQGLTWVASARDLDTPITPSARTAGSGLQGVALTRPQRVFDLPLLHFPINFQATSSLDRAFSILDSGGLLSIKAHITRHLPGHTLLDGLDHDYRAYLHTLFRAIDRRYGTSLWWTSMNGIARHLNGHAPADIPIRPVHADMAGPFATAR